jgi:hypothetical protein
MDYLPGYTVKPFLVQATGKVVFTDGTNNNLNTNQVTCEAYGYRYDTESGTCRSFKYNTNLEESAANMSNKINGNNNRIESSSNFIQVNGQANTLNGFNNNCSIIGANNLIENGVNNSTVLGNFGEALRDGEVVIGGGGRGESQKLGAVQSSVMSLFGRTTSAAETNLSVNESIDTVIARDYDDSANTFTGFEAMVIGVRVGGASGSGAVNDRIIIKGEGIVHLKTATQSRTTLATFGTTTGWLTQVVFSGVNDMHLSVTGALGMDIEWSATMKFYEMKKS